LTEWRFAPSVTFTFAVMRARIIYPWLYGIALLAAWIAFGGLLIFRGPLQLAAMKRQFDGLVNTNDHRIVMEAAITAINTYTNAQFAGDGIKNLAPAIAKLRPSYVEVLPKSVTIEFAGGFDHFGFKIEDERDTWEMSWYTEDEEHSLLTLAKKGSNGEPDGPANRRQPIRAETNRSSAAAGSDR